ncbi:MAG: hypothetical protein V5A38_05695 [Halolamina sp.]|uniref:DUF7519 family protein n=1 Tax=Halolamina sp. TaxID=1940283 RepID=UPI002FC3B481
MNEITRRPSRFGIGLALTLALLSVVATALASTVGAATSLVGVLALATGLLAASQRVVSIGSGLQIVGVLYAGYIGGSPEPLLVGGLTGVLAWDAASNAIAIGDQLGRETSTVRAETVHSAASLAVGSLAVVVGYAVFAAAAGSQPLAALLLLAGGAVALVTGLR